MANEDTAAGTGGTLLPRVESWIEILQHWGVINKEMLQCHNSREEGVETKNSSMFLGLIWWRSC